MSGPAAIAAVTTSLRNLLTLGFQHAPGLADTTVTAQPLDKARANGVTANQVNIFLYLVTPNAAWRNQPIPGRGPANEIAPTPLALNLFYLLSYYGRDNDAQRPFSHHLLGQTMSVLNDHPLLGADELRTALPGDEGFDQIERIRITLQPLSLEEISKLWAGFQMQYRLSIAYELSVVLIDSTRSVRASQPVLTRGEGDRGLAPLAGMPAPFAQITDVTPASPAAFGSEVTLTGTGFTSPLVARLDSPWLSSPVDIPVVVDDSARVATFVVPADKGLSAGTYTLSLAPPTSTDARPASKPTRLLLAPAIVSKLPLSVKMKLGIATVALTCAPATLPAQRVLLLLGDKTFFAEPRDVTTAELRFVIRDIAPGTYTLRLRVDGVDSDLRDPASPGAGYDPARVVKVRT